MQSVLPLFVFVDACGWEIVQDYPFANRFAPSRKKLDSVFGYSSACVPSILSGHWPSDHRNWSYFVYDPVNSPFKSLRSLRWLPSTLTSRRLFRRRLSSLVGRQLNFRGYFDLYNIPFKHISLFDFTEKRSPLQPGGMNQGSNIFDFLKNQRISYHVSDPTATEETNLESVCRDIRSESIDFAFLYWPGLDGLLHRVGNKSNEIPIKLSQYEQWISQVLEIARGHYSEVALYIFSDHGMANCEQYLDLSGSIRELPLKFGEDYVAVYDSTMARFWFLRDGAREKITEALTKVPQGRILPDEELRGLGAFFPDHYFGELIFLVKEGVLIVPSHMGERPIRGMHGYHPTDKQSYAMVCTNQPAIPDEISAIPHMYRLMTREAQAAHIANRSPTAESGSSRLAATA